MLKTNGEEVLRHLFSVADADSSGYITMHEYFMFTLTVASSCTGSGIEAVFRRYDKDGEGSLDAKEFTMACEDMGFGELGHEIFIELDGDESGSVSYAELMTLLRRRELTVTRPCKQFLTTLAFSGVQEGGGGEEGGGGGGAPDAAAPSSKRALGMLAAIAPSWALVATDEEGLRLELAARLREAHAKVADLYRYMTGRKGKADVRVACSSMHALHARTSLPLHDGAQGEGGRALALTERTRPCPPCTGMAHVVHRSRAWATSCIAHVHRSRASLTCTGMYAQVLTLKEFTLALRGMGW